MTDLELKLDYIYGAIKEKTSEVKELKEAIKELTAVLRSGGKGIKK